MKLNLMNSKLLSWDGVRMSPLGMSATIWPNVPGDNECGAAGGMTGRGN
jgi:hypothetical protein